MMQYILKEDMCLMYVAAKSFPDDIFIAHQKLHSAIKNRGNREYFGVSFLDNNGEIHYKAVATENFKGESSSLNLKTFVMEKGSYNYILIPDYGYEYENSTIKNAFKILILSPYIKKKEADFERNYNETGVKCMARTE